MGKLVPAGRICALAGLAWTLQACCCGGEPLPPKPGPAGMVTGQIQRPATVMSTSLEVYAMDAYALEYNGTARYVATHVSSTDSSYSMTVPPGVYLVVARLDGEALGGAGSTYFTQCPVRPGCDAAVARHYLASVRVESTQVVSGIDIGDWGLDIQSLVWDIDTRGSPLPLHPEVSPSPRQLASRQLPAVSSTQATTGFTSSLLGANLQVPVDWTEIKPPPSMRYPTERYFANEQVNAPLALDREGVWLTAQILTAQGCPFPDWRYATSRTTVTMQGGANHFFFEDPPPRDGPQPFAGYSVRGGTFVFGNCVEFIFTGVTRDALENDLVAFFRMIESAQFVQPS